MALESVELISEQYGVSQGTWTGTRVYAVRFDDIEFDQDDILDADDSTTAIPSVGDAWAVGKPAKAIGKQYASSDDQLQVKVTVNYSSKQEDQSQTIENPLSRPTQYSYSDSEVTEPYFRDTDNLPVVNSAGDDFADLPQRGRSVGTIQVTRNVASYNDGTAESYRDLINNSSRTINGTIYLANTLRIVGWGATGPHEENGTTFWTETISVAKNVNGWLDTYEDRGLNQLESGKPKPILDAKNEPVTTPYPLDGSGVAQASATTAPAIITRKPYAAGAFPSL